MSLASVQRDQNKGCKGHIFLPGVLEATLEEKREAKEYQCLHMSTYAPCRLSGSRQGWVSPQPSPEGPDFSIHSFILQILLVLDEMLDEDQILAPAPRGLLGETDRNQPAHRQIYN